MTGMGKPKTNQGGTMYLDPKDIRMPRCPTCGNKRCAKATDKNLLCTNSNAPGQPGSDYK